MSSQEYPSGVYYQTASELGVITDYTDYSGFNLDATLKRLSGEPTIEIAGPTPGGFPIVANQVTSEPIITNIFPYQAGAKSTDVVADFRQLPFKSGAIGMVLASALPLNPAKANSEAEGLSLRESAMSAYRTYISLGGMASRKLIDRNPRIAAMEESARVLKMGGLLVWQGGRVEDIEMAEINGLELVRVSKRDLDLEYPEGKTVPLSLFHCVFQKR